MEFKLEENEDIITKIKIKEEDFVNDKSTVEKITDTISLPYSINIFY